MLTNFALQCRQRKGPQIPVPAMGAPRFPADPATHRSSEFVDGVHGLLLASANIPTGGARHTDRCPLGMHAQPANAAADVRAEATLPGPLRSPLNVFFVPAAQPHTMAGAHAKPNVANLHLSEALIPTKVPVGDHGRGHQANRGRPIHGGRGNWSCAIPTFRARKM